MGSLRIALLLLVLPAFIAGETAHAQTCADFETRATQIREMRDAQPAEGIAAGQEALSELARTAPECRRAEALLHGSIGSNRHILGQNEQALEQFRQGLSLIDANDDAALAILHRGAGVALYDLDRLDEALEAYLDSLAASDRAGDAIESAKTSSNIGNLYNTMGQLDRSREYHLGALERFEAADWPMGVAGASVNLGAVWAKIGEQAELEGNTKQATLANERLRDTNLRALEIFQELGNKRGIAYASNNIATALERLNDPTTALQYHQDALDLRREIGDRFGEIQSYITMASSYIRLGDADQAERMLDEADAILPEDNLSQALGLAEQRVLLAESREDFSAALDYQKEVTSLRSAMADEESRLRVVRLRETFDAEQRELTIESLTNAATVAELRTQRQRLITQVSLAAAVLLAILIALLYSRYRIKVLASAELKKAARTDPLTGLSNRRYMRQTIEAGMQRAQQQGGTFSVIMADVDDFKPINDSFGHEAGDQALLHIAGILTEQLKGRDMVARWGGEEFLIYLPQTARTDAVRVAGILKEALAGEMATINGKELRISMTFGVAEYEKGERMDDCVNRADAAMYKGKRDGKDRVVSFEPNPPFQIGSNAT